MTIADCYQAPCTAYAFCVRDVKTIGKMIFFEIDQKNSTGC
jgi:hypothetical protein